MRENSPERLIERAKTEGFSFAEISGFSGYYVTTDGRVWGKCKNDFFNPINIVGYSRVYLCKDGKRYRDFIHRLVAKAFIPNPHNRPVVNHKDENPANNNVDNLEWCTIRYNNNYGTRTARQAKTQENRKDCSKAVVQMDKGGNVIEIFPSSKEAWRKTGIRHSHIREVCSGKPKHNTAGGYKWRWATEQEINERGL